MKKLYLISLFLFSSCAHQQNATSPHLCKLEQDFSDKKNIFEQKWLKHTTLKGGLSGSDISKVLDARGDIYVFRDISQESYNDKIREIHTHIIASNQDYGPHLHAYDVSKGKIVISFLDNVHETIDEKTKMFELANALKKMHHGPVLCDCLSMSDLIRRLYNKISHYPKEINKNDILKVLKDVSHIKTYPKKPTHRDLNPNNIFFTKTGVKFIDFERSGQDDPFFDIASIIIFYRYNVTHEKEFLKLYFGYDLSQDEQEHLKIMKKTVLLFYGLDLLLKVSHLKIETQKVLPSLNELLSQILSGKVSLEKKENILLLSLVFLHEACYAKF